MNNIGFEGWYFQHRADDNMVAFIPGRAESGAFIQMITNKESRQFEVDNLWVEEETIYAGDCIFSPQGCTIDLPSVNGKITYGKFKKLKNDIMGPFQYLPMECRHGVISMSHSLNGTLVIDGEEYCFDNGIGYIEKDKGISFPSSYLWLQCNDFPKSCSIMLAIANIPFCATNFRGCICAIMYGNQEYRLATYNGVRIHTADPQHICLSQNKLLLEVDVKPTHSGHPLQSPINGKMSGIIKESSKADIRIRLWKKGEQIFDLQSNNAAYEYVPPAKI